MASALLGNAVASPVLEDMTVGCPTALTSGLLCSKEELDSVAICPPNWISLLAVKLDGPTAVASEFVETGPDVACVNVGDAIAPLLVPSTVEPATVDK